MAAFSVTGLCFHYRQEEILGSIWSGFPTHLLFSFLLTQWSRTQAICQGLKLCLAARNIYPNIYISYYCLYITSVVICYLFSETIHFPNLLSFQRMWKIKNPQHFLFVCILQQCWFYKTPINSLLIWQQWRHLPRLECHWHEQPLSHTDREPHRLKTRGGGKIDSYTYRNF